MLSLAESAEIEAIADGSDLKMNHLLIHRII